MVTQSHARNATGFGAIADPIRRGILDALKQGQMPAGELARRFPVSRPAVSRHLRILKDAGLVRESRQSQMRIYSLRPEPLAEMDNWLANYRLFWAARADAGDSAVDRHQCAAGQRVRGADPP
jgi:DNA-binding transcriptional ArsR family regulator